MGRERVKSDTSGYPQALDKIASSFNSSLPLRQTIHLTLRSAAKAMNVSGCALMLLDSSGRHLLPIASYKLSEWYVKKGILNVDKSMGETMNGGAVVVLDAGRDPRVQYGDMAECGRVLPSWSGRLDCSDVFRI